MANLASRTALAPSKQFSTPEQRDAWLMQKIALAEALKPGSPVLNPEANNLLLDLYSEALEEVGKDAFEFAYMQVLRSSSFRPDIAEIRKAAGINRGIQDPIEQKAMSAFKLILAIMRVHGPYMKPMDGKILKTHNENGDMLKDPVRAPSVPAPTLEARTEAAIVELGFGSRIAGLELIACHPAISKECDPQFRLKNAAEIEKRWIQAYAGVR